MTDKKKILLIEDDEMILKPLELALQDEEFAVEIAKNGEEGIAAFYDSPPDLVLLDLVLPKVSGFEVLEKIRIDAAAYKIPIVILSNLAREGEIKRGLAGGAKEYLVKTNFSLSHIVNKIKTYF